MGVTTAIAWTDHTFNPWWGCVNVSPGCDHCYAETFAKRTGHDVWGKDGQRRFFSDKHWAEPLRWDQDQVCSGKKRWQTDEITRWAKGCGLGKVDRFDFEGYRPQPEGRGQEHAQQASSQLLVFKRGWSSSHEARAQGDDRDYTMGTPGGQVGVVTKAGAEKEGRESDDSTRKGDG